MPSKQSLMTFVCILTVTCTGLYWVWNPSGGTSDEMKENTMKPELTIIESDLNQSTTTAAAAAKDDAGSIDATFDQNQELYANYSYSDYKNEASSAEEEEEVELEEEPVKALDLFWYPNITAYPNRNNTIIIRIQDYDYKNDNISNDDYQEETQETETQDDNSCKEENAINKEEVGTTNEDDRSINDPNNSTTNSIDILPTPPSEPVYQPSDACKFGKIPKLCEQAFTQVLSNFANTTTDAAQCCAYNARLSCTELICGYNTVVIPKRYPCSSKWWYSNASPACWVLEFQFVFGGLLVIFLIALYSCCRFCYIVSKATAAAMGPAARNFNGGHRPYNYAYGYFVY